MLIRDTRRHNFFTIDNPVLDMELSIQALVTYMVLCRYANHETQTCKVLLQTIASKAGCGRTNVSLAIKELEKSGLISVNRTRDSSCVFTLLPVEDPIQNANAPHSKCEPPPFASCTHNKTTNNKKENKAGPDPNLMKGVVSSVFEHYINVFNRHPKLYTLTETRMQKGLARLQDCLDKTGGNLINAEQMMVIAVDNLALSKWHNGTDPRSTGRYIDWVANLFKSTDELEKWLNFEEKA